MTQNLPKPVEKYNQFEKVSALEDVRFSCFVKPIVSSPQTT